MGAFNASVRAKEDFWSIRHQGQSSEEKSFSSRATSLVFQLLPFRSQSPRSLWAFFFLSLYFSLIFDLAELNERPVQNPFLPESPPCFDCQFKGWVASRPPLPRRTAGPALFGGGLTFFFLFLFSSCAWLTETASRARPRGCNEHGRGCRSLWVLRFERNFRRECFFFFLVSVKKNVFLQILFCWFCFFSCWSWWDQLCAKCCLNCSLITGRLFVDCDCAP